MPSPSPRQSSRSGWARPGFGSVLVLALITGCGASPADEAAAGDSGPATSSQEGSQVRGDASDAIRQVAPGIQVLLQDSLHLVRGRRVGLITNHTGIAPTAEGITASSIDLLMSHPDVELVALYSPEHGIRGTAEAGERVESTTDGPTGLPIHSLYGATRKPTPAMLEGIDVLLFDIQDVGARYYTYVWTMALAMEAAGEQGIPFVVLDRPNPIGGAQVQGNVLEPDFATFVGLYPVPMRHGLTPGEIARLLSGAFDVGGPLSVVPVRGWVRSMSFADTGLPWVAPSPNMPDPTSALHYPGTCLFEGTNLSVGRGTSRPFQQVGAPFLDEAVLAEALNAAGLPDVRFEPVRFTPEAPGDGKWAGVEVGGVRFVATGPDYDPTRAAVTALVEARRLGGPEWEWSESHFDRLAGNATLRGQIDAGLGPATLTADWGDQIAAFRRLSADYLIYPVEGE